ncbi:methylamine utilization protein MauJ [Chitinibacter tainanensis]|uniref:methylamine utilization protein MauJ n=1 Tax=Chitinibacter tainanensis TaxID=230667 RepID=UPI0023547A24|nr:methylamine utilization protein MauJ [Chitinibacter tainanensis]
MYQCNYYWLFAPFRGGITDTPERSPVFELDVNVPGGVTQKLHLFCDDEGRPHFGRLTIPNLNSEALPKEDLPVLQSLQEHLLSVLRLTYKPNITFAEPAVFYSFTLEGEYPQTKIVIEESGKDVFDPVQAKELLIHTISFREHFRLYIDGEDERIPLQYRFLSFYKLIELRYRSNGRWMYQELDSLLQPYICEFHRLGYTKKPLAVLHELRDRCAHIKTGSRDTLGVTHLNHKSALSVSELLPIMRALCAVIINEQAGGNLQVDTRVNPEKYQIS